MLGVMTCQNEPLAFQVQGVCAGPVTYNNHFFIACSCDVEAIWPNFFLRCAINSGNLQYLSCAAFTIVNKYY